MRRFGPGEAQVTIREQDGRLWLSWRGSAFPELRASFRAHFRTHADCQYSGTAKAWSLPLSRGRRLREWLDRVCEPDAIHWVREPSGSRSYSESRSSYHRYQAQAPASPLDQALRVLCLTPDAPDGLVDAAYRWWSKQLHPDLGGDTTRMARINAAVDVIRADRDRRAS